MHSFRSKLVPDISFFDNLVNLDPIQTHSSVKILIFKAIMFR